MASCTLTSHDQVVYAFGQARELVDLHSDQRQVPQVRVADQELQALGVRGERVVVHREALQSRNVPYRVIHLREIVLSEDQPVKFLVAAHTQICLLTNYYFDFCMGSR